MTDQARFELRLIDDVPVVAAAGEIDMTNVDGFESLFAEAAEYNRGVVVVSLANVTYFDSRTIHAVGLLAARLSKNRQRLAIILPALPSARVIFDMSGLKAKLSVFDGAEAAMAFARENMIPQR
ncbi:MAG: STAS domain-containing protein [Candidatus Velthaea sp.]